MELLILLEDSRFVVFDWNSTKKKKKKKKK